MDVGQTRENRLRPHAAKRNMALNHPGALIYEVDIVHVDQALFKATCLRLPVSNIVAFPTG